MTAGPRRWLRYLRFAVALWMAVIAMVSGQLNAQTSRREIDQVSAIRYLTAAHAGEGRSVRVRGVVTVIFGWKDSFFFQDATAGISVDRESGLPALHRGQEVEIRGTTAAGLFAPVIMAQEVKPLGESKLPTAPLVDLDRLAGGKLDSQWIAIRGIVRAAVEKPIWGRAVLFLDVDVGGGTH